MGLPDLNSDYRVFETPCRSLEPRINRWFHVVFTPILGDLGEMIQFDEHIFLMG